MTHAEQPAHRRLPVVTLTPIPADRFPAWITSSVSGYTADLITLGHSQAEATALATRSIVALFPGQVAPEGHFVWDVRDADHTIVGYLWIGKSHTPATPVDHEDAADGDSPRPDNPWWVWDVAIVAEARGRGLGRAAMLAAEQFARAQGATTLGLSVFGFNTGARDLYESLGYSTTSIKMIKALD